METTLTTTAPRGNDKIWSLLCHLSSFIGVPLLLPFVIYLSMKGESEYVAANAREALNFHLSLFLYALCCIPLLFVMIGIPLLILLGLASFVLAIVASMKAADGGCYHYPLTLRLVS